jgi:uncharacterized membrane protein
MNKSTAEILFLLAVAGAALFVARTGGTLPDVLATHFGPSGAANGFMTRTFYVRCMLMFVVLLPLALNFLIGRVLRLPNTRVNIPHREYWLAPERRANTIDLLQRHMKFFGVLLVAFLCYVHWLLVQANTLSPPALDNERFVGGLAAFMVALITWIVVLRRSFRSPQP